MLFLLRTAFWLTLVLVLIPLGSEQESTSEQTVPVDPVSAFLAAQATVSDIGGFCSRNPEACETGGNALSAIGSRARDGARIVYEFLDTRIASESETGTLVTGSTSASRLVETQDEASLPQPMIKAQGTASVEAAALGPVPRPKPRSGLDS